MTKAYAATKATRKVDFEMSKTKSTQKFFALLLAICMTSVLFLGVVVALAGNENEAGVVIEPEQRSEDVKDDVKDEAGDDAKNDAKAGDEPEQPVQGDNEDVTLISVVEADDEGDEEPPVLNAAFGGGQDVMTADQSGDDGEGEELEPVIVNESQEFETMSRNKGNIKVNKRDDKNRSLNGATFVLERKIGNGPWQEVPGSEQYKPNGSMFTWNNLDTGNYRVVEKVAPAGYQKAAPVEVTVSKNKTTERNIKNEPIKQGEIWVWKVDQNNANLIGATFALERKVGDSWQVVNGKRMPNEPEGFHFRWEKLDPGDYRVVETAAPNGYEAADPVEFTIREDGKTFRGSTDVTNKWQHIKNQRIITGGIKIQKVKQNDSGLNGATFRIEKKVGAAWEVVAGSQQQNSSGSMFTWSGLLPGDYRVVEVVAPNGYQIADPLEFTIRANGDAYIGDSKVNPSKPPKIKNYNTGGINVKKVDAANPNSYLNGATFRIEKLSGSSWQLVPGTVKVGSGTSSFSWSGLSKGQYRVVETAAPAGYLAGNPLEFEITFDGKTKVNGTDIGDSWQKIANTLITGGISIRKVDDEEAALNGAGFTLYKKVEGDWIAVGAELSGGSLFEWSNLLPGEYKIVETTTPAGYRAGADVLFTIDADGDTLIGGQTVTGRIDISNTLITGGISIRKVDDEEAALNGAGFTLYKKVEGDWIAVGAELSGGSLFEWSNLLPGEYKIVETTTPAGYRAGADVLFTIDADGDTLIGGQTVTGRIDISNTLITGGISIRKVDDEEAALNGAGFTLYKKVEGDWVAVGA
ncbi:MAG: SpaA isopeptide-forming pilin-related protein [Christensenellales bacterium]|jgi:uncharacterized surface anchored protein